MLIKRALKIFSGVGFAALVLAAVVGCTEEEPMFCDKDINTQCERVPGHYCDHNERRCKPMKTGDAGAGG
jgi:hypothetical protein